MSAEQPPPPGWREPQPDRPRPDAGAPVEQPPPGGYPPPPLGYGSPGYAASRPDVPATVGELAEWWRRAVAIILDSLILAIPTFILTALLGIAVWSMETDPITGQLTFDAGANLAGNLLSLVVWLVYAALLEGSARGQSLGKMALGIRLCDEATGGPIGPGRAVVRRLIYSVLFYLLVIPGLINVLSPLWDARKQAWHDKAARSLVVRTT